MADGDKSKAGKAEENKKEKTEEKADLVSKNLDDLRILPCHCPCMFPFFFLVGGGQAAPG